MFEWKRKLLSRFFSRPEPKPRQTAAMFENIVEKVVKHSEMIIE